MTSIEPPHRFTGVTATGFKHENHWRGVYVLKAECSCGARMRSHNMAGKMNGWGHVARFTVESDGDRHLESGFDHAPWYELAVLIDVGIQDHEGAFAAVAELMDQPFDWAAIYAETQFPHLLRFMYGRDWYRDV